MAIPNTEDKLSELFCLVRDGTVSIVDAVLAIQDIVAVIEETAFSTGHKEGEAYARKYHESL